MENNALATVAQETLAAFKAMTEDIKRAEEEKDNTTSPVFQLQVGTVEMLPECIGCTRSSNLRTARTKCPRQDADIHYIVQNFWDGQSVLSGCKELRSLALARWIKDRDWAPWNCVLLTKDEAEIHETIGDVEEVGHSAVDLPRVSRMCPLHLSGLRPAAGREDPAQAHSGREPLLQDVGRGQVFQTRLGT